MDSLLFAPPYVKHIVLEARRRTQVRIGAQTTGLGLSLDDIRALGADASRPRVRCLKSLRARGGADAADAAHGSAGAQACKATPKLARQYASFNDPHDPPTVRCRLSLSTSSPFALFTSNFIPTPLARPRLPLLRLPLHCLDEQPPAPAVLQDHLVAEFSSLARPAIWQSFTLQRHVPLSLTGPPRPTPEPSSTSSTPSFPIIAKRTACRYPTPTR